MTSVVATITAEDVLESLYRVIEPERGATIVDLGLVYGVAVEGQSATVEMTLPEPGEEARAQMAHLVETVLRRRHPGLEDVAVEWASEPPWREDFITAEGWQQLANPLPAPLAGAPTPAGLLETLTSVIDPELGINIVDLGLVYGVVADAGAVTVTMTLTTPGCPLHASIEAAVVRAMETRHQDLERVEVELVWDPPWDTDRISPEGRAQLGWGRR
jgi:metal-sulfur cluster biosynthetic enzyme